MIKYSNKPLAVVGFSCNKIFFSAISIAVFTAAACNNCIEPGIAAVIAAYHSYFYFYFS